MCDESTEGFGPRNTRKNTKKQNSQGRSFRVIRAVRQEFLYLWTCAAAGFALEFRPHPFPAVRKCPPRIVSYLALWCAFGVVPMRAQDMGVNERAVQGAEQDFLLRVWETADGLLPTTVRSITQ